MLLFPEAARLRFRLRRGLRKDATAIHLNCNSLALSYGRGDVTKRMLARQSQLAIKSFASCFRVFEVGGKLEEKEIKKLQSKNRRLSLFSPLRGEA